MHKLIKYFIAMLVVAVLLLAMSRVLVSIVQKLLTCDYTIALGIRNDKQEKWLLAFMPFVGKEMTKPLRINLPPLKNSLAEEDCYRQYVIITGALRGEVVCVRFHYRMPYRNFFLLVLGWRIDPSIISLDLDDLASYFKTEPDYQKFFFNPDYTGIADLDDYKPFATIDLSGQSGGAKWGQVK